MRAARESTGIEIVKRNAESEIAASAKGNEIESVREETENKKVPEPGNERDLVAAQALAPDPALALDPAPDPAPAKKEKKTGPEHSPVPLHSKGSRS
mgnify:CR=1 FL=1|jgi:hypothetical protein